MAAVDAAAAQVGGVPLERGADLEPQSQALWGGPLALAVAAAPPTFPMSRAARRNCTAALAAADYLSQAIRGYRREARAGRVPFAVDELLAAGIDNDDLAADPPPPHLQSYLDGLREPGCAVLRDRRAGAAARAAQRASAPAGACGARAGAFEQPRSAAGTAPLQGYAARLDHGAPRPSMNSELDMIPKQFTPEAGLLAGRVILITGAGSGLGRALAIECARAGASVILSGRNGAKLDRVYDEIEAMGGPQPAIALLDLAAATAVDYDHLAKTIGDEFGKLDGLVHAAALLGDRTPLEQYDVPTWCRVLHVNLTAPFILTQVLLPNLAQSADASVIFVSSGVVKNQRPFWGAYAVAKTGLESVRSMLSQELEGEPNIRVNSVNPGRMRTAMRAAAYPAEDPNTVPAPASVSGTFLYLLSALSRGIDGQYIEAQ